MQIENGKWYRRRDGVVVGPVARVDLCDGSPYKWEAEGLTYTDDGVWWLDGAEHEEDLVEEVPGPAAKPASRFKVGDRVRDVKMRGHPTATVFAVRGHEVKLDWDGDDHDPETNDFWPETDFEPIDDDAPVPAIPSPVRTVTRKEIVFGDYGSVVVNRSGVEKCVWIHIEDDLSASDLSDVINTLTQVRDALADALEDQP